MKDAAQDMLDRIDGVLRKNAANVHLVREVRMPFEDLFRMEEGDEDEQDLRREERLATFRVLMAYIFESGPEPLSVLRRIFAIAKAVRPELLGDMSLDDIAIICGDGGKATVSARIQRIYNKKLEDAGQKITGASFQKKSERYAASQIGNKNRRKGKRRKKQQRKK